MNERSKIESPQVSSEIFLLLPPIINLYRHNLDVIIQPYDLFAGQPPLVQLLEESDGISQKDIARRLSVKPASVTSMLVRMEKNGIISRVKDDKDQRVTRVRLTEKGHRICKKLRAVTNFMNERALAGLRVEEKMYLLRLIELVKKNLENERDELELLRKRIFQ